MAVILALLACKPDPDLLAELPKSPPFPAAWHVTDGHLDLDQAALPVPEGGTALPAGRVAWRSGFSVAQTTVLDLGPDIDPATLPGLSVGDPDGIQVWDLTTGTRVLAFAELDAWPELEGEDPVVLVRPREPFAPGSRIAVVVTDAVRRLDGSEVRLDWFEALRDGAVEPSIEQWAEHTADSLDALDGLGVSSVALAVDFPVGDGTRPLATALEQVVPTTLWDFEEVDDALKGAQVPEGLWKRAAGSFTAQGWLGPDGLVALDDGSAQQAGTEEADLYAYIPQSVQKAAPGTAPVWVFGHGIFSDPDSYFFSFGDDNGVIDLANRAGAIVLATRWRGLNSDEVLFAVEMGQDFGRMPELGDRLLQGVSNTRAIVRAVTDGTLLDDPVFEGKARKGPPLYHGISLGGIEGAALLAHSPEIEAGVLHVGGGGWSVMLERSVNWVAFEQLVVASVPSARDRQLLYAASQLFWDPADPVNHASLLRERNALWQMSWGDEQVPNIATELVARGAGATLLGPAATAPAGFEPAAGPLSGPVLAVYDPMEGLPPEVNRPATDTAAHEAPRGWEGTKLQALRFLDPQDPGVAEHFCGSAACSAENPGP